MNVKNILWYLGVFLLISGTLSFLPAIIAILYGEPAIPFMIGATFSCVFGALCMKFPKTGLDFGDSMLLTSIAIILISFFGAIPLAISLPGSLGERLVNGYFDSVSGFTTSGLSVIPKEMITPGAENYHSLVFRRTLSEWLGGLGIVVIFLSILARGGISTFYLYRMESGKKITPRVESTTRIMLRIYLAYTFFGTILLFLSGIDPFHSLISIMSILSTGGFIGNMGMEFGLIAESILVLFMILGSVPFILHHAILSGELKKFFNNVEIHALFVIIAIFIALFSFSIAGKGIYRNNMEVMYQSALGTISTITTTGYTSAGLDKGGNTECALLVVLMFIGGCAGSTAGGLKLIRISVLWKAIQWLIRRSSLPETAILPLKLAGRVFRDSELRAISLFFFIYMVLIGSGFLALVFYGVEPIDALFVSASAQGTVGISTIDLAAQSAMIKIFVIVQMMAGRLEIFPVLALIGYVTKGIRTYLRKEEEVPEPDRMIKVLRKLEEIK